MASPFDPVVDIIHSTTTDSWKERNEKAVAALFGTRYAKRAEKSVTLRAPEMKGGNDAGVPCAAYIHPSNAEAGAIDAKYKRHWEELQQGTWHEQTTELHERHREDLLQVLAYASLVSTAEIVCCLVYPCSQGTWESLAKRGRLFHQAELPNRGRRVRVWLTAIPMGASADSVARPFGEQIRRVEA